MKIADLIDEMQLIKKQYGPDAEISIRSASIKVDGINVSRIYCEEVMTIKLTSEGKRERKRVTYLRQRQEAGEMRESGMTFEDIGLALNVSTNVAKGIYSQYRADVEWEEGLRVVVAGKVFVIRRGKE